MIVKCSLRLAASVLLVLSLALVGTAGAKSFSMSGDWYMNRGPLVDIPINGGPQLCIGGDLQTGCVGVFKPATGGIPGSAVITPGGGMVAPAPFTIPAHAFGQAKGAQTVAVQIVPTVVQLVTSFVFNGPMDVTQAAAASPAIATNRAPAVFRKNAHTNDPAQGARAGANFAWCPGVGGDACASGAAATPALVQGIITYTGGANVFGGTMGMIISGTGATSIRAGEITLPTTGGGTTMTFLLAHLPIMGAGVNPQHPGVSYAYSNSVMLGGAPMYIGYMTSTGAGGGLITTTGPPLTDGMGAPVSIPGDTNLNWGFPWTTGTVSVMNTELSAGGTMGATGTLTAMGTDSRDTAGGGRITLVAGGTSHRVTSGQDFEALEVLVLNFASPLATPSMGPAGLGTVALLMALSAGYAIRERFASKN